MRKLGQHFLKDAAALRRIARAVAEVHPQHIIEIGPGHGELTRALRSTNPSTHIVAVEYDALLAQKLQNALRDDSRTEIVVGDIRRLLPQLVPENGAYTVAGNIPYYLTGFLLRILGELPRSPERTVLTIQREVAERLAAVPPKMNRLAASARFWCTPCIIEHIPRTSFRPQPQVDSATIVLDARPSNMSRDAYYAVIRSLFAQPRKTVENNLRTTFGADLTHKLLAAAHIKTGARPQDLSPAHLQELSRVFVRIGE